MSRRAVFFIIFTAFEETDAGIDRHGGLSERRVNAPEN